MDDINTLRRILRESKVIAVVGLSADWYRPSYFAAKYMQEHGYRVIPVNPKYDSVLGEKCYRSLREVPERVDIVDIFQDRAWAPLRRPELGRGQYPGDFRQASALAGLLNPLRVRYPLRHGGVGAHPRG